MARSIAFALLVLIAVLAALAVYAFPSLAELLTLGVRTLAVFGVLVVGAVLVAGTLKRRPPGFAVILLMTAVGAVILSWPEISATYDGRRTGGATDTAGGDQAPDIVAPEVYATLVDEILAVADASDREIEAAIVALTEDPAIVGALDTANVLRARTLAAAEIAIGASLAKVDTVNAAVNAAKDRELALLGTMDGLPDAARTAFLDRVGSFIADERADYHELVALQASRLGEWAGMINFLQARAGDYEFYPPEARARFGAASVDGEYIGYLSRLRTIAAEEERLRARLASGRRALAPAPAGADPP